MSEEAISLYSGSYNFMDVFVCPGKGVSLKDDTRSCKVGPTILLVIAKMLALSPEYLVRVIIDLY